MKLKKLFKVDRIDELVYRYEGKELPDYELAYNYEVNTLNENITEYKIELDGQFAHRSRVFNNVRLLKLLKAKAVAIGDCLTPPSFRGKSLYPYMLTQIIKDYKAKGEEVYILVAPDNIPSIKGIEKAGFTFYKRVKATRFLLFYFNVKISDSK